MPARASISAEEATLVAAIVGDLSLRVTGDEFGVDCRTPHGGFHLFPSDEVGALAPGKPEEVVRVGVRALTTADDAQASELLVRIDEAVARVTLLRTAVWFSAPKPVGETVILDVVVPAGQRIDVQSGRPSDAAPVGLPDAGLNIVDAALCCYFDGGRVLVIGTDGWSYRLTLAVDADARAWVAEADEIVLDHIIADSREAPG